MPMVQAKCENCGGILAVDSDLKAAKCLIKSTGQNHDYNNDLVACVNHIKLTRVEFTNYNTAGLPMDWITLRGRTYEEIINEVEFHIRRCYEFIANHYCDNIRNGHR